MRIGAERIARRKGPIVWRMEAKKMRRVMGGLMDLERIRGGRKKEGRVKAVRIMDRWNGVEEEEGRRRGRRGTEAI